MSDHDRFVVGTDVARQIAAGGSHLENGKDASRRAALRAVARKLTEDALALADRFKTDEAHGDVIYEANMALSHFAYRDGDRARAIRHLRAAVASPGSERLRRGLVFPSSLVVQMLKDGERDVIIDYFEGLAKLDDRGRDRWLKDAENIREGKAPSIYPDWF